LADRYVRQFEFTNAVDLPSCPVGIEKGAVLLDTKTNTYCLQLKLSNIGTVTVKSVRIYIEALNSEGTSAYPETPGIAADYNETAMVGEAFGTKQLLPLPNNNAVTFRVYIEKIETENGDVLTFSREQHTTDNAARDIAAERENAFETDRAVREAQVKEYSKKVWGAKWYHIMFALWTLLYLITRFWR